MDTQRQSFLGPDAARNFYKNVRAYDCKEKPPNFNPSFSSSFSGKKDKEASECLADHFTVISNELSRSKTWPADWKQEQVTVIPKCTHPETIII